jgi:MATE family multidrug resistance protein
VRAIAFFAVSEGLVMSVLLVSVRHIWGRTFSDEEEVVAYVAKMVLLIAVTNFLDGIQSVLSGNIYKIYAYNDSTTLANGH